MSDNPKHVTVRLRVPPELRDKIAASSEQYNRSMNADMVARLEESFENGIDEINDFITFIENESEKIPNNQTNALLVTLFKNWLAFKKAP
ncbi:Arc family DNA-binding protein [Acinetobacter defluvii]|uniref:Arc family DNA-binding protein n=1 Tax=Acinetobacter defluvii TaxID=1871111 RepID=UPI003AF5CFFA